MRKVENPFLLNEYQSPAYFCNRNIETRLLEEAALNGRDVTLYALRRMGKSGLIEHAGRKIAKKHGFTYIYSDIYHVSDVSELAETLANQVVLQLNNKKGWINKIVQHFKHIGPMLSFDEITGAPQLSLTHLQPKEALRSLDTVFLLLEQHTQSVYWAWDEFQQLNHLENSSGVIKKVRGLVQQSKNIRFVFSGSHTSMLLSMFSSSKQAFYRSTQLIELKEIGAQDYAKFIQRHFKRGQKQISSSALKQIEEYTLNHTWYVQALSNRLYQMYQQVDDAEVRNALVQLLKEHETHFYRYRRLLTSFQWKLLVAIAKEEKVLQPTSGRFIHTHQLGSSASVLRALNKLVDDEFVVEIYDKDTRYYRVNDVFLIRWVQWKYG